MRLWIENEPDCLIGEEPRPKRVAGRELLAGILEIMAGVLIFPDTAPAVHEIS
jgi:hypothetical protein